MRSAISLASSAYLASAASTADRVNTLLPARLHQLPLDASVKSALLAWQAAVGPSVTPPMSAHAARQRAWDEPCCRRLAADLLEAAADDQARARLQASQQSTSGAWLEALPIASVGLRLDNETVRMAVGLRLGLTLCEPHVCHCGAGVDARGIHGLACKRSAGRHPRHGQLNDVIWRAMQRAKYRRSRSQSAWSPPVTFGQTGPQCCRGPKGVVWHGM